MRKGPFWIFILALLMTTGPLRAAEKQVAFGQTPPAVARGKFAPISRMAGTNELRLALSLPVRNPIGLTNLLASVYAPGSPLYHHYLTPQEFAARFGPTPAEYAAVVGFASTNGLTVTATHRNRLVLDVAGRAADVERAFHVKLQWYRHPTEPRNFFAPDAPPTVDAGLPLLHVSGLDDYFSRHPGIVRPQDTGTTRKSPQAGSSPGGYYMGNDFRQAYVPGTTLTGAGQCVDLVEFDAFRPEDITNYVDAIGLTNDGPQVTVISLNGGIASPGNTVGEVTLDIDMVLAMAPGVSNIFVYEAPNPTPWVDVLSQIANDDLAAQVSCSWNGGGPDPASEQIFQQMALQGQSFFNAAGDNGAFTNVAPFPCASPNVTEVGGTFLDTDTNGNYVAEAVWNRDNGTAGGGGVGLAVELPVWQMGVDMTTNGGSTIWRNVPDVALTAEDIYVIVDGQGGPTAGTSCAAPLWAGLMALVNQQAAQLGQQPVGFLNPMLYGLCRGTNYGAIFHDITLGNNTNACSGSNYYATAGFDLCTGWGTPAGTNLINAFTTPDPLGILPQDTFEISGLIGGPFSATNWVITLTNSGAGWLHWSLGGVVPNWLSVPATNGTLGAHGSTNLALALVQPGGLPMGGYEATLMFTNREMSRVQNVLVRLDISRTVADNLVQNGGFETGDFSDWTLVGDTVTIHAVCNIVATAAEYPGVVHSGVFGALLGEQGSVATLSQAVPTTPGQAYLLSCWVDNLEAGSYQQFSVDWDGANLMMLVNPDAFTWTNFQFVVTASDTNTTLEFDVENDPNYFGLDDVVVTPLPPIVFTSYSISTNGFQMAWPSFPGLTYTVQFTPDLTLGYWSDIGSVFATTNLSTFIDTNCSPPSVQGFYQLVLQQ
jgi:hypothetical protein